MIDVTINIPMAPIGKGRGRIVRVGNFSTIATPEKTRTWMAQFAEHAARQLPQAPIEGAVRVDVLAVLPRPKRLLRRSDPDGLLWAPTKPDRDNVDKAVLDALKRHWRDDALVVCGEILKCYAEKDGLPRTVVRIRDAHEAPIVRVAAIGLGGREVER